MKRYLTMVSSLSIRRVMYAAVLFAAIGAEGYAQTTAAGKQLLDKMIQALGGNVFLEVREIQTKGRFYQFKRDQVSTADLYADFLKFPDRDRTEFGREKAKTIQINAGIEGWIIRPPVKKGDPEIQEMPPSQTEAFLSDLKTSFDYMVRFVANTPQASVLAAGSEVVDFKRSDILEIRDAQKNLMRIFIDRETGLPLKIQKRLSGESILHEDLYANWHKFGGVMTPLMVVRFKDGVKTMEIRTESVEYNPGFADSLFLPPARTK